VAEFYKDIIPNTCYFSKFGHSASSLFVTGKYGTHRPTFQGHTRSLEPTRINWLPMTSCIWSIANMDLFRTISEINGNFSWKSPKKIP